MGSKEEFRVLTNGARDSGTGEGSEEAGRNLGGNGTALRVKDRAGVRCRMQSSIRMARSISWSNSSGNSRAVNSSLTLSENIV